MAQRPPDEVIEAIEDGRSKITRRAEIYQSDGITRWFPDDDAASRLIDGSVGVDYNRDERRSLDITLDNSDNALRPDPDSGLWYDKVIKTFRGITYTQGAKPPKTIIMEEDAANKAYELRAIISKFGYYRTSVDPTVTSYGDIDDYEIIISYMRAEKTTKAVMLNQAFAAGKCVITIGSKSTSAEIPMIASTVNADWTPSIEQTTTDNPLKSGWASETYTLLTGASGTQRIATIGATSIMVAKLVGSSIPTAVIATNAAGGKWFHYQPNVMNGNGRRLLYNALEWMRAYSRSRVWEAQLGEFVLDSISESHFPHHTKVVGRDYTKRCLNSKFEQTATFSAGASVIYVIKSIAANCGITKFRLPNSSAVLGSVFSAEKGTERWNVMKTIAQSYGYEIFFDNQGYLTMRLFIDPALSGVSHSFKTGTEGNLVSWERSTNDSRIYNHIIVSGDTSEDGLLPFFGEAKNTQPGSPTRISRIGDRSYFYTSSFFTSDAQCIKLANDWLKLKSLESYEMNWTSFNYPWMEVGEVVEFLDPRRASHEPTRFLMDTLSIPLGLGPMSATGKRVTYVDDPNAGVDVGDVAP